VRLVALRLLARREPVQQQHRAALGRGLRLAHRRQQRRHARERDSLFPWRVAIWS
jgi:hypothetical protein